VIAIATMDLGSPQLRACCRVGDERRGSEGRHDCDPPELECGVDNKSLAPPRSTRFPSIRAVSGQPDLGLAGARDY
jgi:hypothetical protein